MRTTNLRIRGTSGRGRGEDDTYTEAETTKTQCWNVAASLLDGDEDADPKNCDRLLQLNSHANMYERVIQKLRGE